MFTLGSTESLGPCRKKVSKETRNPIYLIVLKCIRRINARFTGAYSLTIRKHPKLDSD